MDNTTSKANSFLQQIFSNNSTQLSFTQSYLILENQKINELLQYISQLTNKVEIDYFMNTLKDNFLEIRMNTPIFVQSLLSFNRTESSIFHILFTLFLSFKEDPNPPQSILHLLEILLMYGYTDCSFSLDWLFTEVATNIRNNTLSLNYLSNYFKIIKYFYGYTKNSRDFQALTDHSLSYFAFFPTKNKGNGILLFTEDNSNFNFNKSIGVSTWFKFPFKKNNVQQLKEIYLNDPVEIMKIRFGNDKHISIQIIFNAKENVSLILILQNDFQLRMRNTQNDDMIHLYLEFNGRTIRIWVNGNKMETPFIESYPMNKINKMQFYNNFFGEVYSIVIYSNPIEMIASNSIECNMNIETSVITFNEYYDTILNYEQKAYKNKPCLVYLPYAKGENVCKNYANNIDYSIIFPKRGAFIHNYSSHIETINKYYGLNALLPLFEYLYTQRHLPQIPDLINSFFESVQMYPLYKQANATTENLNKDFFFVVSMFLEKMPDYFFNELFGKRLFNSFTHFGSYNSKLFIQYSDHIFLNELILIKYSADFIPWTFLSVLRQSSEYGNTILRLLSISQMLNALLNYDTNIYKELCCNYHHSAVKPKHSCSMRVMEPCLNDRTKALVSMMITKMRIKKDITITPKETNEFNEFNANEEQKDQMEKYKDLLLISKSLSLNHSPCMKIQLLTIMKECFSTYDKVIFQNCRIAIDSPFLDVKNKCIELLIGFINSDNSHLDHHKIAKLLHDHYLSSIPFQIQDNQSIVFTEEYIEKSMNDNVTVLINWLLPLSKEIKVNLIGASDEDIKDKGDDKTKTAIIDSFKKLIENIMNYFTGNNNSIHPFNKKMTIILISKLNSITKDDINKLSLLCDKYSFKNKLNCIIKANKDESGLDCCNANCIILYYHLVTMTISLTEIVDQFQLILPILLAKNSLKCSQQGQFNLQFSSIIEETLTLYITIFNQLHSIDIQYHIIDLISVSFNYFVFIINYNSDKEDKHITNRDIELGLFNISKQGDELWKEFTLKILTHFSPYWNKKQFEVNKDNYSQLFDDLIVNTTKDGCNSYHNDINFVLRMKQQKKGLLHLPTIVSLIYINSIFKSNESERTVLIQQYKQFLFYLSIISVYDSIAINQDISQSLFFDCIELGLGVLNSIKNDDKDAMEAYEVIIKFFNLFKKGMKTNKESFNQKGINVTNSIMSVILNKRDDETAMLLLISILNGTNNTDNRTTMQPNLTPKMLMRAFELKIQQDSVLILDNYHKEISLFITDKARIFKDKVDELKKLQLENLNSFIAEKDLMINRAFIKERKKRMKYYKIKKALFFFNGPWSEKDLFSEVYNEKDSSDTNTNNKSKKTKLKTKILNHYTKSFTRPFLISMLDINQQLPHFTLFKTSNLFYSEDKSTPSLSSNSQMDVNDILDQSNLTSPNENKEDTTNTTPEPNNIFIKLNNPPDAYYLKCLSYKNDATHTMPSKETCKLLTRIRSPVNTNWTCCLIKSSHHIKGEFRFSIDKRLIEFLPFINRDFHKTQFEENDMDFDIKKQTCFGGYLRNFKKDYNKTLYSITLNTITHIFLRSYLFRDTGIEIFTNESKSYYLNFLSENTRKVVFSQLEKLLPEVVFSLNSIESNQASFETIHKDWTKGIKSNLMFLMQLNLGGNRTFNDLSQYPVFPWVITDYSSQTIPNKKTDYRDLSLPIGMITLNTKPKSYERQQEYITNFENLDDSNDAMFDSFYYGSFYSNPLYVTHYLVRLFPMSVITIEIQGDKFDDPNRLFFSVELSFENAITQKGDVRELVPEFYFLPEMFINQNNFNFGYLRNKTKVDDVECPLWANRDPYRFVVLMRKFIEDETVSANLHLWVDLIFGAKQRGEEAKEAKNLFASSGYNDSLKVKDRTESVEFHYRIAEFGLIPKQLFTIPLEAKIKKTHQFILKDNVSHNVSFQIEKHPLNGTTNKTSSSSSSASLSSSSKMTPIRMNVSNKSVFLYSNDDLYCFTYKTNGTYERSTSSFGFKLPFIDSNNQSITVPFITNRNTKYLDTNNILLVLEQGNSILQGEFFDGNLLYSTKSNSKFINTNDTSPICIFAVSKNETIILAGNERGSILYFKKSPNKPPILMNTIHPHRNSICSLHICNELNAFASASCDDYVHIYTLTKLKMVHSFKVKGCSVAFLSESPLASIAIYSNAIEAFVCYSVNGHLLRTVPQEKPNDSRVIKDSSFFDYLISLNAHNQLLIQSFPYLDKVLSINIGPSLGSNLIMYYVEDDLKSVTLYSPDKQELYRLKEFV